MVIDVRNMKEHTQEIADRVSLSVPVLLDDKEVSRENYGISATPTTFIVDRSGKAMFKHIGYEEGHEAMLEREIQLLLNRKPT